MQQTLDVAIPAIAFLLLTAVGLDLTLSDFSAMRRRPRVILAGVLVPLVLLPIVALGIVTVFEADTATRTALLLIAACPIGGISNTYSYLARAATALSVMLTGFSCLLAVVTIPLIAHVFEVALGAPLGFSAPAGSLAAQLAAMLAVPVGLGMWIRQRYPSAASNHRPVVQRVAFGALALLIVLIVWAEFSSFAASVGTAVPMAATFVAVSMGLGWATGGIVRANRQERFTLAVEFSTRNVAIATAIAVTLLGRVDLAVFATTYLLTEVPLMLAAIAAFRRAQAC